MSARLAWTAERVQTLSKLWLDGRSASEIAHTLGGNVTRNAVIGKVHRLGLGGRARPSAPVERRTAPQRDGGRALQSRVTRPTRVPRLAIVNTSEPTGEGIHSGTASLLTLAAHACRWPFGDPPSEAFGFCGRTAVRGAYCAAHAALAFRPPREQPRPDRLLRLARLV